MKGLYRIATIIILIVMLAGCATPPAAPAAEAPAAEAPVVEAPAAEAPAAAPAAEAPPLKQLLLSVELTPQEEWLKANSLGSYDTGAQDWDAIEAAAKD